MSVTDYVIDLLLIAVIFRQIRPHGLNVRSTVLPLVLLAAAGAIYLRPFPAGGNDLTLVAILCAVGIALGALSGLADRIWHDRRNGRLLARASAVSVITWVLGMGARFGFAYYANHSGASAVGRFSRHHGITAASVWTAALVFMAFGQVLTRLGVLQARRIRSESEAALMRPAPAYTDRFAARSTR